MPRVKKMQTEQSIKVRPKVVPVRTNLESIFECLVTEFGLSIKDIKLGIDMIRDSKARGDKYSLHYQRFWRDENLQDEGLNYSAKPFGWPLDIYVSSDFGNPSLTCTVPANKLMEYRVFLTDTIKSGEDIASNLALGSYLPDHNNKKQIFQNVDLPDFSEVHDFLRMHIQAR